MFRRKLLINLCVVLVCGTIAISLPVIVNHMQRPAQASEQSNKYDWELTSELIKYDNQANDICVVWQITCKQGKKTVESWQSIYQAIQQDSSLIDYDTTHLQLTKYGFAYRNLKTTADYQTLLQSGYQTVVTYNHHQCSLTLH